MGEMLKKQQNIRYIGAEASHQNGEAERVTKTVITMARTMLICTALRFSEETFSSYLWPMELYYAV